MMGGWLGEGMRARGFARSVAYIDYQDILAWHTHTHMLRIHRRGGFAWWVCVWAGVCVCDVPYRTEPGTLYIQQSNNTPTAANTIFIIYFQLTIPPDWRTHIPHSYSILLLAFMNLSSSHCHIANLKPQTSNQTNNASLCSLFLASDRVRHWCVSHDSAKTAHNISI